ncbi:hypothetical protein HQ531_01310 [bacterium]|nr:hypothetical protein [bacterium]
MNKNRSNEDLDVESMLGEIHSKIHRRSNRRKAIYSSPVIALLVMMVFAIIPRNGGEQSDPGKELLMAGWEDSWTESQSTGLEETEDILFYEQSLDYVIDEQYFSYIDEGEELLDDEDLEAFRNYLEEV